MLTTILVLCVVPVTVIAGLIAWRIDVAETHRASDQQQAEWRDRA